MNESHQGLRWTGAAVAALLLGAAVASPASARLDPGGPPVENTLQQVFSHCPLERIGQQLVHCDALTGAGVPAPSWVLEQ